MIEAFIDEALVVLEDGLITFMETHKLKTQYDNKIYGKSEREILELDAAEKILRKCMIFDIKNSPKFAEPTPKGEGEYAGGAGGELDDSVFLYTHRNKESDGISQLNNLAKDIRYLYRMKELEDTTKTTSKLMDAVPVTGLILARMFTLENESRTVLELWEEKATVIKDTTDCPPLHYTGFKKFKEGGGEGNVARMLVEGGILHRHGKRKVWSVAIHIHVTNKLDHIILGTPASDAAHSKPSKQVPISLISNIHTGKSSSFCFYAVDSCCFSLILVKGGALNLETKTSLERDKWVAAFKWLLATRDMMKSSVKESENNY